ncbi:hypothetical protein C8R45DRAFT_926005 [Mycena sanguinolenta]|nr:hypothetical protein C8R45DRAFT_926005 [Mycena sanguinolenta]
MSRHPNDSRNGAHADKNIVRRETPPSEVTETGVTPRVENVGGSVGGVGGSGGAAAIGQGGTVPEGGQRAEVPQGAQVDVGGSPAVTELLLRMMSRAEGTERRAEVREQRIEQLLLTRFVPPEEAPVPPSLYPGPDRSPTPAGSERDDESSLDEDSSGEVEGGKAEADGKENGDETEVPVVRKKATACVRCHGRKIGCSLAGRTKGSGTRKSSAKKPAGTKPTSSRRARGRTEVTEVAEVPVARTRRQEDAALIAELGADVRRLSAQVRDLTRELRTTQETSSRLATFVAGSLAAHGGVEENAWMGGAITESRQFAEDMRRRAGGQGGSGRTEEEKEADERKRKRAVVEQLADSDAEEEPRPKKKVKKEKTDDKVDWPEGFQKGHGTSPPEDAEVIDLVESDDSKTESESESEEDAPKKKDVKGKGKAKRTFRLNWIKSRRRRKFYGTCPELDYEQDVSGIPEDKQKDENGEGQEPDERKAQVDVYGRPVRHRTGQLLRSRRPEVNRKNQM